MPVLYGTHCTKTVSYLTKLKKETKLSEAEILAAIGWLAREGMEEHRRCEEREGTLLFRSI